MHVYIWINICTYKYLRSNVLCKYIGTTRERTDMIWFDKSQIVNSHAWEHHMIPWWGEETETNSNILYVSIYIFITNQPYLYASLLLYLYICRQVNFHIRMYCMYIHIHIAPKSGKSNSTSRNYFFRNYQSAKWYWPCSCVLGSSLCFFALWTAPNSYAVLLVPCGLASEEAAPWIADAGTCATRRLVTTLPSPHLTLRTDMRHGGANAPVLWSMTSCANIVLNDGMTRPWRPSWNKTRIVPVFFDRSILVTVRCTLRTRVPASRSTWNSCLVYVATIATKSFGDVLCTWQTSGSTFWRLSFLEALDCGHRPSVFNGSLIFKDIWEPAGRTLKINWSVCVALLY